MTDSRGINILQNSFSICKDDSSCKTIVESGGIMKFDNMAYEEYLGQSIRHTGRLANTILWRIRTKLLNWNFWQVKKDLKMIRTFLYWMTCVVLSCGGAVVDQTSIWTKNLIYETIYYKLYNFRYQTCIRFNFTFFTYKN